MDDLVISTIEKVLSEMRLKALQLQPKFDEEEYKILIHEYNAMFLGEKANHIYSFDVLDYVKNRYNLVNLTKDEFNAMLPSICKRLKMEYHPMVKVENMKAREIDSYQIILF